ncbi:MAG: PLP-dependent aminotransferase family protein [Candidatus Eremiobacteraeota bacterium]|nr:PLP-dependent aminotransferase family protein [Candidatus Eremiobacteraeota bacterium]
MSTGRAEPLFELALDRASNGAHPSSQALYAQLRDAIVDGRLAAGAKLPPTRRSAAYFGVSRNTAADVYERLMNDGFVVTRPRAGTYVADALPAPAPATPADVPGAPDRRLNPFWMRPDVTEAIGFWRDRAEREQPPDVALVDFRPALVDVRLFPYDVLRRTIAQPLLGLEKRPPRPKSAQGNAGSHALREAITKHIALTRAVACRAGDVVVTSGAQQAFDLLARVLVEQNRTVVAVEDPGYPPLRVAFAAAGATVVPVEVDADGLVVERIPSDAAVICVSPSHQFPLGVTMSAPRRAALVAFARRRGAVIVEDDYDGEFRYDGSPLQALHSADAADVVFYVGTFSKCMLPSLRLGFVVAPGWALRALVTAKNALDWHCSVPVQLGVAGFIAGGHLTHHVRRMRRVYAERRTSLLAALRDDLGAWLEPLPSFYGMHVAALARTPLDLEPVADALLRRGVNVHTLARYHLGPAPRAGLVFGYGAAGVPEIRRGLTLVREAFAHLT